MPKSADGGGSGAENRRGLALCELFVIFVGKISQTYV